MVAMQKWPLVVNVDVIMTVIQDSLRHQILVIILQSYCAAWHPFDKASRDFAEGGFVLFTGFDVDVNRERSSL